ncbi:MAG: hypothetical protein ABTQ29_03375, partial [Siculibacillus sp.]
AAAARAGGTVGLVALGALGAHELLKGLGAIGDAAGGKHWTPKSADDLTDLKGQLAEVEATMARLREKSRVPDMLPALLAPHEAKAADLRGRIGAGEAKVGAAVAPPPPQKVEVSTSVTVKVDGPGQVVSSSTKTTGAAPVADRGPTVGRP